MQYEQFVCGDSPSAKILEKVKQDDLPVLCFVDEVLRGTNTIERISASTEILKSMAGRDVICFAATHDRELAKREKALKEAQ